jgi:hypothetical protein
MIFNPRSRLDFVCKRVSTDKESVLSNSSVQEVQSSNSMLSRTLIEERSVQEEILRKSVSHMMRRSILNQDKQLWYPNLDLQNPTKAKFSGSPLPKKSQSKRISVMAE